MIEKARLCYLLNISSIFASSSSIARMQAPASSPYQCTFGMPTNANLSGNRILSPWRLIRTKYSCFKLAWPDFSSYAFIRILSYHLDCHDFPRAQALSYACYNLYKYPYRSGRRRHFRCDACSIDIFQRARSPCSNDIKISQRSRGFGVLGFWGFGDWGLGTGDWGLGTGGRMTND